MQLAYCLVSSIKQVEICRVVGVYLIRATSGRGHQNPLSKWFLLIMAFGLLFHAPAPCRLHLAERAPALRSASRWKATPAPICSSFDVVATAVVLCYGQARATAKQRSWFAETIFVHHRDL